MLFLAMTSCAGRHAPDDWRVPAGGVAVTQLELHGIDYVDVVPKGWDEARPLPLIVFLHGRGDRPRVPDGPFLGLSEPVRLVVPRAPERLGHGYTWLPVSARNGESPELVDGLERTSRELANFIEALVERHPTLGSPIVMGFSQGGMLSFTLAVDHPEVVGAAFPLAGWLPPSLMPSAPRPHTRYPAIRAMHGTDDPILRASRTRSAVTDLARRGYEVTLYEYEGVDHQMTPTMWRDLKKWVRHEVRLRLEQGERAVGPMA
jgi:phospholipase/carboxylesterase